MKFIILSGFLLISNFFISQNRVKYTLYGEAHALMCPFLSPKLMDLLTKKGAEGIFKDQNLLVHFTTTKENELSDEIILKLIDDIGYEPKNFTITRINE